MKKEKTLRLGKITVQTFVTSLGKDEQKAINGGSQMPEPGGTSNPIFCKP